MDFQFTPAQEKLRGEFEDFFREAMKEAPPTWGGGADAVYHDDDCWNFHLKVARKLAAKEWLVLPWPKEYGGKDAPVVEQMIFSEVMGYYNAPGVDMFGVRMIGPTLLVMGNEEQKKEHLTLIAKGERMFCQGWSEPDAGSDLAALTTRAARQGDHYIVNGQKVWTTGAHRADWIFLLVRTNPDSKRSQGLSLFLVDMKTPGITVNPLLCMDNTHLFNEVFFDNVKVPAANRVGEEGEGWKSTHIIMNFERSMIGGEFARFKREFEDLVQFCKETKVAGTPLINNPRVQNKLMDLSIDLEVARVFMYKTAWLADKGELQTSMAPASAAKVFITDIGQRLAYMGCQIMGMYGQVKTGSKWAWFEGRFERELQLCMGGNIAGGSTEIQMNLIAWTGLNLPRI